MTDLHREECADNYVPEIIAFLKGGEDNGNPEDETGSEDETGPGFQAEARRPARPLRIKGGRDDNHAADQEEVDGKARDNTSVAPQGAPPSDERRQVPMKKGINAKTALSSNYCFYLFSCRRLRPS